MRILLLAILLFCASAPARAASGFAGEFLAVGAGARALALGNASVALTDDATATYWNPAALAGLDRRQAHLTHAERFSGLVDQDYIALALPGPLFDGIGIGLLRLGVGDIQFTTLQDNSRPIGPDNRPLVASTESSADYALYISAGHRLHERLSLGLSAKLIYRSVGPFSAYGVGLDLGARYALAPGLVAAATLRDATTTPVTWDTDASDRIQPSLLLGLSYTRSLAGGAVTAAFASRSGGDASSQDDAAPLQGGIEYAFKKLALRVGFEEDRTSFGLGLALSRSLDIDLAYLQHDALEATYLLSTGFRF